MTGMLDGWSEDDIVPGMIRALFAILVLSFAPAAHALSVCPTSDFSIDFASGDAQIDAGDLETIEAAANRARQCDVSRIELIVEGDLTSEASLGRRRAASVAREFVERGFQPDMLQIMNEGSQTYGSRNLAIPEHVRALIFFD
ncbi:MAG: hypothetical protein NT015_14245 [Alphaproteobacteria bacterium]|nr:hypothetical protein [Alphaproteobacteria bacterium]